VTNRESPDKMDASLHRRKIFNPNAIAGLYKQALQHIEDSAVVQSYFIYESVLYGEFNVCTEFDTFVMSKSVCAKYRVYSFGFRFLHTSSFNCIFYFSFMILVLNKYSASSPSINLIFS
jgi:hypothetical protein